MTSSSDSTAIPASVGRTAPRRGRPGHDPDAVLRAAVRLFTQRGYHATSMADVARELGVTKAALYHHVRAKEGILARALETALGALEEVVRAAAAGHGPAVDRLAALVHGSVRVLTDEPEAVTLLLRVRGTSPVEEAALRRRRAIDTAFADLVRAAQAERAVRADLDPALAARLVFGTVNSLVEWYRPRSEGAGVADGLAAAVTSFVFAGLAGSRPDQSLATMVSTV